MVPLAIPLRVSRAGSPSEPAALSEPQPAFDGPLTPADGPTWVIRLRKQDQEEIGLASARAVKLCVCELDRSAEPKGCHAGNGVVRGRAGEPEHDLLRHCPSYQILVLHLGRPGQPLKTRIAAPTARRTGRHAFKRAVSSS